MEIKQLPCTNGIFRARIREVCCFLTLFPHAKCRKKGRCTGVDLAEQSNHATFSTALSKQFHFKILPRAEVKGSRESRTIYIRIDWHILRTGNSENISSDSHLSFGAFFQIRFDECYQENQPLKTGIRHTLMPQINISRGFWAFQDRSDICLQLSCTHTNQMWRALSRGSTSFHHHHVFLHNKPNWYPSRTPIPTAD